MFIFAFLQVRQCFLAVFLRWSSRVLLSLCIPMSIWLQFFPGDPSGGPPVLLAFWLRPLRQSTSTPVLVPMLGGSCTLPGASNHRFPRLSFLRRIWPLWLHGTISQPHRTSWPARMRGEISRDLFIGVEASLFPVALYSMVSYYGGGALWRLHLSALYSLFFICGSSSLFTTAAAADQYSGARPNAWWKLHASWC